MMALKKCRNVTDCESIVFTLHCIPGSFDKLNNTSFLLNFKHLIDEAIRSLKAMFLRAVRNFNANGKAANTPVIKKLFVRFPLLIQAQFDF
jgi:hypothetical protein